MRLLPRKKSKNATREKIKEATIDLLAEKGYASISTRDITKRADTAVGQLTYYYKTKDSLIIEVIDDMVEALIDNLKNEINESENKEKVVKQFFDELIVDDVRNSRIIVDLVLQALYNNPLSVKAKSLLNELSKIISGAYENDENAQEKADELINSVLGKIVRDNIKTGYNFENMEVLDEQEDIEKTKKQRKSKGKKKTKKKISMRAIFD